MRTIAFVPVRGGSKSIPGKNIRPIAGRPLLHWTLEAAVKTPGIDAVYVSSDSPEILQVADDFGSSKVILFPRPAHLATDTSSTEEALLQFAESIEFERVVLIQATSPLTESADLEGALACFVKGNYDSLLSGTIEHRFRWAEQGSSGVIPENYDPRERPRRQDWKGEPVENGAFYISSRDALRRSSCRISGRIGFWTMAARTRFEIDSSDDWEIMEALLLSRMKSQEKNRELGDLKLLVTDVDGVLTDGGMYYGADGDCLKKFNTRDGMGFAHWRSSGRELAIVTGENSEAVARRAEKLGVKEVHLGIADKLPVVQRIAKKHGLSLSQIAYIGDDVNDLEVMKHVGLCACPADARPEIRAISHYMTSAQGGQGCVREFIEWMLSHLDRQSNPDSSSMQALRKP